MVVLKLYFGLFIIVLLSRRNCGWRRDDDDELRRWRRQAATAMVGHSPGGDGEPSDCCTWDEYIKSLQDKLSENVFTKQFSNASVTNITVLWTGQDDSVVMVVTLNTFRNPSSLYISEDFGKSFVDKTLSLHNASLSSVHQNTLDRKWVVFVSDGNGTTDDAHSILYVSSDGKSVTPVSIPFRLLGDVSFHLSDPKKMLAFGNTSKTSNVWLSEDGGFSWKSLHDNAVNVQWGQCPEDKGSTFYFTNCSSPANDSAKQEFDLVKATKSSTGIYSFRVISKRVKDFKIMGKFLYVLVFTDRKQRKSLLRVSTNGGVRWNEVQLPVQMDDKFYKIIDMSDGIVFIHVDNPSGNGGGVLYTSGSDGIVFSESLQDHLYPKEIGMNDFYKVQSMRGVYMTSVFAKNSPKIRTLITFNRGAKWSAIRKPANVDCFSPDPKACELRIISHLEMKRTNCCPNLVTTARSAIGIVLAHGFVGDSSEASNPDVFLSSDGGYNWAKVLGGPHLFAIADHGGLLVAVPNSQDHAANTLKFSLDEGQTWYCHHFSAEKIRITGLLTDPESWSLKVGIWGYGLNDSLWIVTVVDFQPIIGKQCKEPNDFGNFTTHSEISTNRHQQGCLLGSKETFRRVNKGSKCYLGQAHVYNHTAEQCRCTEDDFECDFGYSRVSNGARCQENPKFKGAELDICLNGEEKKIVTHGYRKIPGDVCRGGYNPGDRYEAAVKVKCREGDKVLLGSLHLGPAGNAVGLIILVILIVVMTGLIFGMSVFFIRKFHQINTSPISYRYSRLSQDEESPDDNDDDETMCIVANSLVSEEMILSSDDEMQPATLLIDTCDAADVVTINSNGVANRSSARDVYEESDEELLQ